MAFINEKAHDQSAKLAEERGPFPNWAQSIYRDGRPLRNATVTTIAPDRHDLDHRRLLVRHRAALRARLQALKVGGDRVLPFVEPVFERGRRASAASTRTRSWKSRQARRRPRPGRRAGGRAARLRDRARDRPDWHVRTRRPSSSTPTTACPRPSTCPTTPPWTTWRAPTSSPGSSAASASPCSATAARTSSPPRRQAAAATSARRPPPRRRRRSSSPGHGRLTGRTYRVETPLGTAYIIVNEHGGRGARSRSSSRWARPGPTRWRSPRPWGA